LQYVDLSGAETVVTQNLTRSLDIHQHMNRCHTLAGVLQRKSVQVVIKLVNPTVKPGAIMQYRIQCVFFKHV
jgi:sensor histidine kinase regulating citrate/malate metabolism